MKLIFINSALYLNPSALALRQSWYLGVTEHQQLRHYSVVDFDTPTKIIWMAAFSLPNGFFTEWPLFVTIHGLAANNLWCVFSYLHFLLRQTRKSAPQRKRHTDGYSYFTYQPKLNFFALVPACNSCAGVLAWKRAAWGSHISGPFGTELNGSPKFCLGRLHCTW